MIEISIILLAVIIDLLFGELPNKFHPVAWLGKVINMELRISPSKSKYIQTLYGIIIVMVTTFAISLLVYYLFTFIRQYNEIVYVIAAVIMLKFTFSIRGLLSSALKIKTLLQKDELVQSRDNLNTLVSRNTYSLNKDEVISATVESVSENTCDSFIAPLFYFLILGLPGAIAYRIVNTFDSMIGYHGEYEYTGKCAAIADDVLNYIPARISALLIVLASFFSRQNMRRAWSIMVRDHKRTESPNAGWTMSAMAGALGISLSKTGHYRLGDPVNALSLNDIDSSIKVVILTFAVWSLLAILLQGIIVAAT
jgi:adenosylcobinamide-phosphate synthase